MKENSFEENLVDTNNNSEGLKKEFLISSQEELVKHLKNAHDHTGVYMNLTFGIGKYLDYNPNNDGSVLAVKLVDMLYDGVIAPNAINNLDEILEYRNYIWNFDDFLGFLYEFYDYSFSKQDIGTWWVMNGHKYVSKTNLENAVKCFNTEQLKQNPTRYIINLAKQKANLPLESYGADHLLENYLLPESIQDISDLNDIINRCQNIKKIKWSKLHLALRWSSIKNFDILKKVAEFGEREKIDTGTAVFAAGSIGNWQKFFEICERKLKHHFIFGEISFYVFKAGAFKGFNLNDTQTLKEYGLIKKSRLMYPLYALWDIGRIIVWVLSFGQYYANDRFFRKTRDLYRENHEIEEAIKRIKENQEKAPVPEKPKEIEEENEENKNNIELTNEPKLETYDDKHQKQDISVEDMK